MSERPPGRDPPNTIRTFGVSYHLNRRFARNTPTQKSVTSGNPPSKQIWFISHTYGGVSIGAMSSGSLTLCFPNLLIMIKLLLKFGRWVLQILHNLLL